MPSLMTWVMLLCALFITSSASALQQPETTPPKIAIVIDDLGHHRSQQRFATLPGALTLAILPHAPYATTLAEHATENGKEIIIHMPMEAVASSSDDLGVLRATTSHTDLVAQLEQAFVQLPQAVGLNNHMGSHLTTLAEPMHWVMTELAKRQLYFLDSRTSAATQAEQIARQVGVATARRHIFLDNTPQYESIQERWQALLQHAAQHGSAIAIAHPHRATYEFLAEQLPQLADNGVQLVFVSELVQPPTTE